MLAAAQDQLVAKGPATAAACGTVHSEAVGQQATAVGPSSGWSQCSALGFMQGRRSAARLCAAWRRGWCIYMEVWLYRQMVPSACADSGAPWVISMQAAIAGLPTACETAATGVRSLTCCWCSRGGVRGSAGTATLPFASAAVSSRDHKCQINQERMWGQGPADGLAVEEGVSYGQGLDML